MSLHVIEGRYFYIVFVVFQSVEWFFLSLSVLSRSYEYQVYRGDRPNNVKMEITPTSKSRENTLLANKKPVATLRVLLNSSTWQKIAWNWYGTCVDIVHNKLAYLWDLQNLLLLNVIDTGLNCKKWWQHASINITYEFITSSSFEPLFSSLCQRFLRLVSELNPFFER